LANTTKNSTFAPSNMQPISEIYDLLYASKLNIGIIMHQKPDADAMGSTLGLSLFLKQLGHETTVVSPTNWPSYLDWMQGTKEVYDYEGGKNKTEAALSKCDWLFCLDFNHFGRTKRMADFLTNLSCTKVLIDHHQEPQTEAFNYGISDTKKSSTCEMVYDFIMGSGKTELLNKSIAECLYSGSMTDTGSFRFGSTTPSVHRMVAHLLELGAVPSMIHENLFDNFLENRLRFMGHVLCNCMEVFYEYNTVLISIPNSDLVKYQITTGDTEGLVNLPQSIQGIKMVAVIIDRYEEIKMSFRSKGSVDVNTFARKYFNGGGHVNASGGNSKKSLSDTVKDFKVAMKESAALLQ
jgi:bifunctional oligoribonuclease and PAP phosphatase NrnA